LDIFASQDHKFEFVIKIASGTPKYDGIVSWLMANTKKKSGGYLFLSLSSFAQKSVFEGCRGYFGSRIEDYGE
jgi:hypothetical protein